MNRLSSMSLKLTIHITNQITILLAVSIQNWGSSSQDKTLCCALRMDLSCLTRSARFRQVKSKLFHWTPFPLTGKKGNCPKQTHSIRFRFHPCTTPSKSSSARRIPSTVTTLGQTLNIFQSPQQGAKGRCISILWINTAAIPSLQESSTCCNCITHSNYCSLGKFLYLLGMVGRAIITHR